MKKIDGKRVIVEVSDAEYRRYINPPETRPGKVSPDAILKKLSALLDTSLTRKQRLQFVNLVPVVETQIRYGRFSDAVAFLTEAKTTIPKELHPLVDDIVQELEKGIPNG